MASKGKMEAPLFLLRRGSQFMTLSGECKTCKVLKGSTVKLSLYFYFSSRSFDKSESGFISEDAFKQIMSAKDDVNEDDISEMLDEYYR